ncbi:hypothetical protein GLOIN_2v1872250 [Rhizophagus irregularis DAOM 181602=DAOM 197198]|uniref:Uncharacterized protein n=2 Tax=Rhizophagus irregularis TaxID=588596 RepID=U9T755_RHIID|nr:hypothetical protein GLOIN_2v1872250 [Rhizophagus irregularis DAOM 181602=DAOM 197198]
MPFECPQDVANDYESLLTNTNIVDYDVIIYAGNKNGEIYAHSFVLRTRSQYFRTEFSNGSFDSRNGKIIFNLPNITPQLFNMILRFIYCGKIDLDQLAGSDILNLLIAVNEINIQRLIDYIQEYMIKNKDNYVQQNSIEILEKIHQNNAFVVLQNICIKKICEDTQILLSKFNSLSASLLELILNRDDLPLDEIVIWDNLIRWAQHDLNISQVPDPAQWKNDKKTNMENMERTIHRFIPLIRFCHISPENFTNNVYPFREIMPNNLVNSLVQFNMTRNQQFNNDRRPPRSNIDSVIIDQNHIAVFANWIYRKDKFYGYIPYRFNLLYRASRDSNTAAVFHNKCDNKGATLVIVKIANSNQIVGGYSPLSWDISGARKFTNDSFVFSFANRDDLQNARVGYCNSDSHSIYCCSLNGPVFGRGSDLGYYNGVWYCHENFSYPDVGIPLKVFNMDDYEVFQVVSN